MRADKRTLIMGTIVVAAMALVPATSAQAQNLASSFNHPAVGLRAGLNLVPTPFGQFTGSANTPFGTVSASADTAFAFGLCPYADYAFHPNFFVGFAPQFTFHVKAKDANDSGEQLDLLIRAGANAPIADTLQLYGYVAPGYSILIPPHGDNPTGFVLGFHGGAMLALTDRAYANFELGYQFGYQSVSAGDAKTDLFQFGLGIGTRL
ncbi:MAG TPA: outer membrane beta-barrel protein [Polyangia bacterium]|nr:outer membrane beta-barrel protein [Polyangia bacterium]